jgi:YYY domain-containing protein
MIPHVEFLCRILVWDLIGIGVALAAYPCFRKLLPAAFAWPAARLAGPAAVAYAGIAPSVFLGTVPFTRGTLLGEIGALAAIGWAFLRPRKGSSPEPDARSAALSFELAHLSFLLLATAFVPFIASLVPVGERLRDTSLLNAVWTQRIFPFQEPWLAGYRVQYYTFGYFVPSVIGRIAGDDVLAAYNLMIGWTFVTYAAGLWVLFRATGFSRGRAWLGVAAVALSSHPLCLAEAFQRLCFGAGYDWWTISRVITNTITEFPVWTATLGDLHPHYLAMPFLVLFLGYTLIQLFDDRENAIDRRRAWVYVISSAPLLAWIWGSNTWELPVALVIAGASLWLRGRALGWKTLSALFGALIVETTLLASPFFSSAPQAHKAFGWVHVRTSIGQLWLFWGFFFVPILIGTFRRLQRHVPLDWFWGGALVMVISVVSQSGTLFILATLYFLFHAFYRETPDRRGLPVFLATAGFGILLGCELVHLQDIFGESLERLNTVFKFYIPAWALLGISAVLFVAELAESLPRRWGMAAVAVWAIALSGHLTFGLAAKTNGYAHADQLSGMDFWSRVAPDDAQVMEWAHQEVEAGRLAGVTLEAGGGAFSSFARFATVSGLSGYLGWQVYGGMLQTVGDIPELGRRAAQVKLLYGASGLAPSCADLRSALLSEKIDYVMVGQLERQTYPVAGLDLMVSCLPTVYRAGGSALLRVGESG